jgi:hypothetical protein
MTARMRNGERRASSDTLREEFIVCYAPGYPDPYRPHPNTLEHAKQFAVEHQWNHVTNEPARPVIKRRLISDWEEVADA